MFLELLRNEREFISTFDPQVYVKVIQSLQKAGIHYREKATNTGSGSSRNRLLGSMGETPARQIQYQVFINKKDVDQANHECRHW